MAYIRVIEIVEGSKGTSKFDSKKLDYKYCEKVGLLKYSAFLHDMKVGDTCLVSSKDFPEIQKKGEGVFKIQMERPKYANHSVGTDVYPYEIIEWKTDKTIMVREMDIEGFTGPYDGHCEGYKSNPNYEIITLREHKNGAYYIPGSTCCPFIPSESPYYYRDPSF